MDQIDEYCPPPNPAKITDSRASAYIKRFGYESWELDALEPQMLTELIQNEVTAYRDDSLFYEICERENREKNELRMLENNYDLAIKYLRR